MQFHGRDLQKGRVSVPNQIYVVTAVTCERKRVFADSALAKFASRRLHAASVDDSIKTLAWVVMPDHIHWMFALKDGPLYRPVQRVKSFIARDINAVMRVSGQLWQKGYHDRAMRSEEDVRALARYIVLNPVRAGLVSRASDYPYWNAVWL
ncbi:REP-associated tyrosine transposase [Pseudomonas matsuisoli]|uniref:Transposase n=1 Tax=Pseudomonas matsuisoli TaxID=1515666 RepID=A0A917PUR5_9PSED|nr:transposase [Pseudomonas matsuisoli]GGJ92792.1 transposase [Pseudomonas matsuisoli]